MTAEFKLVPVAGFVGGVLAATLQGVVEPGTITAGTVLSGVLTGACVLLFGMFIRQGNKLAALEAYSKRNKDDIDKVDGESRTVDKRIEASRHLVRGECTVLTVSAEERLMVRLEELRERVAVSEERLQRHLEAQATKE